MCGDEAAAVRATLDIKYPVRIYAFVCKLELPYMTCSLGGERYREELGGHGASVELHVL